MVDLLQQLINVPLLLLAVAWTMACSFVAIPLFLFFPGLGHKVARTFGKGWLFLLGIRVKVQGLENLPHGGVVLAPNHSSNYDIPVLLSLPIDSRWISKKEVRRIPLLGLALKAMGSYFVTRDNSGKDLNVMKEVEEGLREGVSVVIFPEGTRTRTGELLPFKKGAFKTALNANVPICPIAITGTRSIAPPGKMIPSWGHHVSVRIGAPIMMAPTLSLEVNMERVREALIQLLAKDAGMKP